MRRRALHAALLLALGIVIAHTSPVMLPALWFFVLAGVCALSAPCVRGVHLPGACLALACVSLGIAIYTARANTLPADSIEHRLSQTPMLTTIMGQVVSAPERTRSQRGSLAPFARYDPLATRFTIRCERIAIDDGRTDTVSGTLLVRVTGDAGDLHSGERVRLTGLASRLRPPGNPGGFDAPAYYAQQDLRGRISLATPELIERVDDRGGSIIEPIRARARAFLEDDDPDNAETRALLSALLLGQRDHDIGQTGPAFRRLGIAHILAISGLHLGLVAGFIVIALRIIGDHPRLEALAILVTLIAALVLIPARAPILRAALMLGAFLGAECAGRRYDRLNTLAIVAIAILFWRPSELFSPGFQLSFLAVGALLVYTPVLRERMFGEHDLHAEDHLGRWFLSGAKTAAAASICAWAITTPLAAYHFGIFTPFGAPVSVLLTIPVALTLVVGYASMIIASIIPALADSMHALIFALGDLLRALVLALDARAWSVVSLPRLSIPWTIASTSLAAWWLIRGSWRDARTIVFTLIVAAWTAWRIVGVSLPGDVALRVDAIDVADGSCYLLRSQDDAIMFDCGSTWFGMGESSIPQAVRAVGSPPVRTVIVSHADTDHYSALLDASGPMVVRRVLTTPQFLADARAEPDGPAAYLLEQLNNRSIEVRTIARGDTLSVGSVALEVLWPPADAAFAKDNDASLVILARIATDAGERSFLLTGDIERDAMDELRRELEEWFPLGLDAMEAPHHGSARDFAGDFVLALDPRTVIQSTGFSRLDDPRWAHVREGRAWFVTTRDGAVALEFGRDGGVIATTHRSRPDAALPDEAQTGVVPLSRGRFSP